MVEINSIEMVQDMTTDPDPVTRRENYVKLFGTLVTIAFCYSSSLIKIQVLCRILSNSSILVNRSMGLWQQMG